MNNYPVSNKRSRRKTHYTENNRHPTSSPYPKFIHRLAEFREDLDITRKIFSQDEVWPDQCDYVVNTFEATQRTLGNLAESVNAKKQSVQPSRPNRYATLTNAYYLYDQIDGIISIIRELDNNKRQRSRGNKSQMMEIRNSLNELELSFHDLISGLGGPVEDSQ
jgi:hypothetical protein